jgi:hypothetical protein
MEILPAFGSNIQTRGHPRMGAFDTPVSPTMRGYPLYLSKFNAISFHRLLKTAVLPVKCKPANSRYSITCLTISGAGPGTNWITDGGRPASRRILWVR